jgi:hypothetical protein
MAGVGILTTTAGCVIDKKTTLEISVINNEERPINATVSLRRNGETVLSQETHLTTNESEDGKLVIELSFDEIREDNEFTLVVETERGLSARRKFLVSCRESEGGSYVQARIRNGGIRFKTSDCRR